MRLAPHQVTTILEAAHAIAGNGVNVSLYGSRLDDTRRGGDLDLLVESFPPLNLMQRARLKMILEQRLNLPVDLIAAAPDSQDSPFVAMARLQARRLDVNRPHA
jgi:uncharacterized protein